MSFDVLIRGATVVGAGEQRRLDVGVADGLIAALGPELAGPATEEIDAAGLHLLPGARGLPLELIADVTSGYVSRRFRLHRRSPFLGRTLSARITRTLVRGRTVFVKGRIVGRPAGRLLIPTSKRRAHDNAVDHCRSVHLPRPPRGGARTQDVRGVLKAAAVRAQGHPRALER